MDRLVRLAIGGDRDALAGLLACIYPDLLAYLVRVCGQKQLAEDLCQDAMVRIIRALGSFRPPSDDARRAFYAWAFTIATNLRRDRARRDARLVAQAEVRGDCRADVEERALEALRREEALAALRSLPEGLRAAFVLKVYHGFSYRETGRILGCREGTAKSRVHNAILAMRDELKRRGAM